jgi:hypothetical protein
MSLHSTTRVCLVLAIMISGCGDAPSAIADASTSVAADASMPDTHDSGAFDANTGADAMFPTVDAASDFDAGNDPGIPFGAVPIVAPSVCQVLNHRLRNCAFGPISVHAPSTIDASPLVTVITAGHSGDCATQFEHDVGVTGPGLEPGVYHLFHVAAYDIARPSGAPIEELTFTDESPFAGVPIYDESCRVWLEIAWNTPAT